MVAAMATETWTTWEYPLLRAIGEWEEEHGGAYGSLDAETLIAQFGGDDDSSRRRVRLAVKRLHDAGLIEGYGAAELPHLHAITGLTPAGLRGAGLWPNPENFMADFIEGLRREADAMESVEPERSGRLRSAASYLASAAKDVGVDFMARLAARAAGLG